MDITKFSSIYTVRKIEVRDLDDVLNLCQKNPKYYEYCPPKATINTLIEDMKALPPKKTYDDKYYIGYFKGDKLVAVMDYIESYPEEKTDFLGFFMVDNELQNKGVGSSLITELCKHLKSCGKEHIKLGWVKENYKAASFWHKNGFNETGVVYDTELYSVIVAEKKL